MAKKREKKKDKKKVVEERTVPKFDGPFTETFPVEEDKEIIEEYKDYVDILKHEPISPPEPIKLPKTKRIRYLGTVGRFIIKGPVTGVGYTFTTKDRIGTTVATKDYEGLLQRVRPARKCCGGKSIPEQPYFGPV